MEARECGWVSSQKRCFFFFKQKTAYEIPKRDWSSDVCSSDLARYVNKHYGTVRHTETYGWLEYNQAYWSGIGADVAAFNQVSEGLMKRQAEVRRKGKFEADH